MNETKPVLESALRPAEWHYLCRFLNTDLASILKMTNIELLRAVNAEISRRGRRGLIDRIMSKQFAASNTD